MNTEPLELGAGNTWTWTREFAGYPAVTWTLAYHFKNAASSFSVSGADIVASGSSFVITKAAAATASIAAGRYGWQAYVTSGSTRFLAASGEVQVQPDFSAAGARESRSIARQMLDAIEAYLLNANNLTAARYQIGGRSLDRWDRSDLLAERSRLKYEVQAEEGAAGRPDSRRSYVRFSRG
jgi:hypothetical protein